MRSTLKLLIGVSIMMLAYAMPWLTGSVSADTHSITNFGNNADSFRSGNGNTPNWSTILSTSPENSIPASITFSASATYIPTSDTQGNPNPSFNTTEYVTCADGGNTWSAHIGSTITLDPRQCAPYGVHGQTRFKVGFTDQYWNYDFSYSWSFSAEVDTYSQYGTGVLCAADPNNAGACQVSLYANRPLQAITGSVTVWGQYRGSYNGTPWYDGSWVQLGQAQSDTTGTWTHTTEVPWGWLIAYTPTDGTGPDSIVWDDGTSHYSSWQPWAHGGNEYQCTVQGDNQCGGGNFFLSLPDTSDVRDWQTPITWAPTGTSGGPAALFGLGGTGNIATIGGGSGFTLGNGAHTVTAAPFPGSAVNSSNGPYLCFDSASGTPTLNGGSDTCVYINAPTQITIPPGQVTVDDYQSHAGQGVQLTWMDTTTQEQEEQATATAQANATATAQAAYATAQAQATATAAARATATANTIADQTNVAIAIQTAQAVRAQQTADAQASATAVQQAANATATEVQVEIQETATAQAQPTVQPTATPFPFTQPLPATVLPTVVYVEPNPYPAPGNLATATALALQQQQLQQQQQAQATADAQQQQQAQATATAIAQGLATDVAQAQATLTAVTQQYQQQQQQTYATATAFAQVQSQPTATPVGTPTSVAVSNWPDCIQNFAGCMGTLFVPTMSISDIFKPFTDAQCTFWGFGDVCSIQHFLAAWNPGGNCWTFTLPWIDGYSGQVSRVGTATICGTDPGIREVRPLITVCLILFFFVAVIGLVRMATSSGSSGADPGD